MKKIYKIFLIICAFIIVLLISLIIKNLFSDKKYEETFNFNNKEISIIISCKNKNISKKIFDDIGNVFNDYSKYLEKTNDSNNLYYINHNFDKNEYIEIDNRLYELIKYGIDIYSKSDGLIDISKGNVIALYNSSLLINQEPSKNEIEYASKNKIEDIVLEDEKIKNNHININVDYIIEGYVYDEILYILEQNDIDDYIINNGENVKIGSKVKKVGINDPDQEDKLLFILEEKDSSISIVNYKYDNIINKENVISKKYKSVVAVASTSKQAEFLAKTIFLLDENKIDSFLKNNEYEKIYVYTLDNELLTY